MESTVPERRLRRDAEINRRKILDAAGPLLTAHGLAVGHDRIAREAGVAVGTVYRRFPDREALVTAVFADEVERVVTDARAALEISDPWEALVRFMTTTMELQTRSRGLRELISGAPGEGYQLARRARASIAPVVRVLVRRAHAAGVLRGDVREQDLAVVPIMIGSVVEAARGVDDRLWRRMLALVLDGMRPGDHPKLPGHPPRSADLALMMQGRSA